MLFQFIFKFWWEKEENKQKEAATDPFLGKKRYLEGQERGERTPENDYDDVDEANDAGSYFRLEANSWKFDSLN